MRSLRSLGVATAMGASLALHAAPAPFEVRVPNFQTYGFEEGVPMVFSACGASKLIASDAVFKAGGHSLRWEWTEPGATLTYRHDEAFKHLTGEDPDRIVYEWVTFCRLSTLSFWIYSEAPIDDHLWFEIGDGKTVDCRFWMELSFKGWRQFLAMYGRDIPGFPNQETADTLRIIAPRSVAKGALHFDLFCPRTEQDVRFVRGTEQTPWVRNPAYATASGDPGEYVKARFVEDKADRPSLLEIEVPQQLSPQQLAEMSRLTENCLGRYLGRPIKPRPLNTRDLALVDQLRKQVGIVRHGDTVSGTIGSARGFWLGLSRLASLWNLAADQPQAREKLGALFVDCADLWTQHGRGAGYGLRDYFARPVALMRDELRRHGKLRPLVDSLRRVNGVQDFYNLEARANADVYNTVLRARLFLIFVGDDSVQKYRDLKALQHWLERTARYGEIRPDGSFFHHNQTYSGYNLPAIGPLVDVNYLLHDTEFAARTSHLMARRIACAMHMYTNATEAPHTLSGRWRTPGGLGWGHAQMYRKLAEMGNPETGATFVREMAEIYLYYASHFGKSDLVNAPKGQLDEWVVKFCEMGLKPHNTDGHLSLNYTVAAIHRRDKWMVFFRGQRREFMAAEAYAFQAGNTMGRYLNYGHLAIISGGSPPNSADSGWPRDRGGVNCGWSFNFWPGTTTREIPHDALRSRFEVEEFTTAETFAAGTSLDGNGIFGLKLGEDLSGEVDPCRIGPPKYWLGEKEYQRRIRESRYDTTFRARKSVFCFDNRILCLGSDIASEDAEHRVCTTLFQHSLRGRLEQHVPFPQEQRFTFEQAHCLTDRNGTAYYLPAGNDPLTLIRRREKRPYHSHWSPLNPELRDRIVPNEGDIELAILDHGKAPKSKGYEYCIVMKLSQQWLRRHRRKPETMEQFAKRMTDPQQAHYEVLRKDRVAHIVHDRPSKTTGYVIFESDPLLTDRRILSVDKPCLVMVREVKPKRLRVSVCDPELSPDAGHAPSPPTRLVLRIAGNWRLSRTQEGVDAAEEGGGTTLTVPCQEARPLVLELNGR